MKQLIIISMVALIAATTSCSSASGNKVPVVQKVSPLELARVQLAFYSEFSGKWEVNPRTPITITRVHKHLKVGDTYYDRDNESTYMILSYPEREMSAQYSIDLVNDSEFIVHSNWDSTTLAILKLKDNKTLDSLILADND